MESGLRAQDGTSPVLAFAKPDAVAAFGLNFPQGKFPQLESRFPGSGRETSASSFPAGLSVGAVPLSRRRGSRGPYDGRASGRLSHQLTEDYDLSAGAGRHSRARRQTRPGVARREGGFVRPLSGKAEAAVPVFRSSSRRGDVRRGEKKKPGSSS